MNALRTHNAYSSLCFNRFLFWFKFETLFIHLKVVIYDIIMYCKNSANSLSWFSTSNWSFMLIMFRPQYFRSTLTQFGFLFLFDYKRNRIHLRIFLSQLINYRGANFYRCYRTVYILIIRVYYGYNNLIRGRLLYGTGGLQQSEHSDSAHNTLAQQMSYCKVELILEWLRGYTAWYNVHIYQYIAHIF